MLEKAVATCVLLTLVLFCLFGGETNVAYAAAGDLAAGAAVYKAKCASCHGPDGSGATTFGKKNKLADLRAPAVQKLTDAELYTITAKGRKKMPAYEKKLNAHDIMAVVAHLRVLAKKP